MDLIQFFTLLGSILGGVAFIWVEVRSEIKAIRSEAHAQACRTDKLYEMFIDLLKQKK